MVDKAPFQARMSIFADMSGYGSTEGIAIDSKGNLYVSTFLTGEVLRITPSGSVSSFAKIPGFIGMDCGPDQGNALVGLAIDGTDNVYALAAAFPFGRHSNDVVGVWRIGQGGKNVEQFVRGRPAGMQFPNFAVIDVRGTMYLSDSSLGAIYKVSPAGTAAVWCQDPLLGAGADAAMPIGVNGIGLDKAGNLYAAVTYPHSKNGPDVVKGRLAKVTIKEDGTAGVVTEFADVIGPDGVVFDADGSLYVAQNYANNIAKLTPDGALEVMVAGPPLAMPASMAIRGHTMYVTNLAFPNAIPSPIGPPNITAIELRG